VYPDVVASINGGYANTGKEERANELLLSEFIMGAAEQLHQASAQKSIGLSLPPPDCPVTTTE
jgi:hypothetical protein